MDTTPHRGTSLEVLAPYLPFGIQVLHLTTGKKHPLLGLSKQHNSVQINPKHSWEEPLLLSPILRPFSALVTPLEDGSVPAVEVAAFIKDLACSPAHLKQNNAALWIKSELVNCQVLTAGAFQDGRMPLSAATYLRSKHFAVGLTPSQFIEK